jgi:hypothetical protein
MHALSPAVYVEPEWRIYEGASEIQPEVIARALYQQRGGCRIRPRATATLTTRTWAVYRFRERAVLHGSSQRRGSRSIPPQTLVGVPGLVEAPGPANQIATTRFRSRGPTNPDEESKMDRREFLKKAGLAPVALASLPMFPDTALAARGPKNWRFVAFSRAQTVGGVDHRIAMHGSGTVSRREVTGAGSYVHFNGASPVPQTILGTGTWTPRRVLSFTIIGEWGRFLAGVAEMVVRMVPRFPPGAAEIRNVVLKVVCNLGPAGISTGQAEGFFLTIPGAPFGTFQPLTPPLGLTIFSKPGEERD